MLDVGKLMALGALALLVACGSPPSESGQTPDFFIHGTGIVLKSAAPFTQDQDFPARIESTIDAALEYWGGSWQQLDGRTVTLEDAQHVRCGDSAQAFGCNDGDIRITTRDPSLGVWHCVEETVLVHEVGHAVIGDPEHIDPRWMDFLPVLQQLDGRPGYAADGEATCQLYLSVWRHVLRTR